MTALIDIDSDKPLANVSQAVAAQLQTQNLLLAKIAKNQPLGDLLNSIIHFVEQNLPEARCCILRLDNHDQLRYGAAPNLPTNYLQAIDGTYIGEGIGSCGTAAFRHETVIVSDIATDPLWQNFRELALQYELRACWSFPIITSDLLLLGTFGIYYPDTRSPQPAELEIIAPMVEIAGLAINRQKFDLVMQESHSRWQLALESVGDGLWDWDIEHNTIFLSPQWKLMIGYSNEELGNRSEEWDSRIHPDDKAYCYAAMNDYFSGKTRIYETEHRLRCKDGNYKWILDRGKVIEWSADGHPARMIGIHTDISERKQAEQQRQMMRALVRFTPLTASGL